MKKKVMIVFCSVLTLMSVAFGGVKNNTKKVVDAHCEKVNTVSSAPSFGEDDMIIIEDFGNADNSGTADPYVVGGYGPGGVDLPASPYLRGCLTWFDDIGYSHPLQFVTVQIMNRTTGALIATLETDENGYYGHSLVSAGQGQIYIKVFAHGANIAVYSPDGIYSFQSADYPYNGSGALEINASVNMGSTYGQAFQISQAIITAARYAQIMNGGEMLPMVNVMYPDNNEEQDTSYYRHSYNESKEGTICIKGKRSFVGGIELNGLDDYENWDTLMHEYGHHVSYFLDIFDGPGGSHYWGEDLIASRGYHDGTRVAWTEGYATVFSQMAQEYYEASLQNISYFADKAVARFNYQVVSIEELDSAYKKGAGSETATLSVLYDLYDSQNEGADKIYFGHQFFWDCLEESKAVTLSQFVDYLYTEGLVNVDRLGESLGDHGFVSSNLQWTGGPKFTWDASSYTEMTDPHVYPTYVITFKNAEGSVIHSRECIYNYCEISMILFLQIKIHGTVYVTLEEIYQQSSESARYISQTFEIDFNAT